MKNIGVYLVLIFLLVREIYSQELIKICILNRFESYVDIFRKAYKNLGYSDNLQFSLVNESEKNFNNLLSIGCDISMIEPDLYSKNYHNITDINEGIQDTIAKRTNDDKDGKMYKELLSDLRNDDREGDEIDETIRALPLFMDYGILYYRSDIIQNQEYLPDTWDKLISVSQYLYESDPINQYLYYTGQFTNANDFYYNLFENIINTNEKLNYKVIEKETKNTIEQFRKLFDSDIDIIEAQIWSKNSDNSVNSFVEKENGNENGTIFMRNWSSYLYNITMEYANKDGLSNGNKKQFKKAKTLHSEKDSKSKAINKGIYLCVLSKDNEKLPQYVEVVKAFTTIDFMKYLINEPIFYDLPAYSSLLSENNNNIEYCNRIDCKFFRELQKDHVVAGYNVFYQNHFYDKFETFFQKCKDYFMQGSKSSDVTIDSLMSLFADLFQDKYIEFGGTLSIVMIIIIAIEILITIIVAFYIIKYKNFIEIRRSSPLFLIIMLIGIILSFASVLTFIGKPTDIICVIRPYIIVLAFGLTFYSLLLKTFRIKVIFDKVNIKVKDSYLIMYLCIILGIELILVTLWTVIGGIKSKVRVVNDELHYYTCKNSSHMGNIIVNILININALALLYGCYLAYKVKNVYSEYNESKIIGLSIYGVFICMVILFFITNIESLDLNTLFLIQSLMIILSADIILVFMFTPKLWKLHINSISQMPYGNQQMYMY